jgi:drug/metabolite transporter (DMT)-like permease
MLAVRLVAALIFGWIFLDERLISPLQWAGVVLVVGSVTWFLLNQRRNQPAQFYEKISPSEQTGQDW